MDDKDLQGLFLLSKCYIAKQDTKMSLSIWQNVGGFLQKIPENSISAFVGVNSERTQL